VEKYDYEKVTIPETSGIYFLYGEKDELLYIGKSTNLKKRLYAHFKRTGGSKFKYMDIPLKNFSVLFAEEEELDKLERQMILKYLPPFNKSLTKIYYKGKIKVSYEIEEWLHDELKVLAVREKENVSKIVNEMLKEALQNRR